MVYYAYDPSPGLYHHGIKGQQWGVRRFQNPDGTWTEEGRKRYSRAILDKNGRLSEYGKRKYQEWRNGNSIIKVNALEKKKYKDSKKLDIDENDDATLKKGSIIGRQTSIENESIDDRPKYAYVTDKDRAWYKKYSDELGSHGEKTHEELYEVANDLRVAGYKTVNEYMFKVFGNVKVKDIERLDRYTKDRNKKRVNELIAAYGDMPASVFIDQFGNPNIYMWEKTKSNSNGAFVRLANLADDAKMLMVNNNVYSSKKYGGINPKVIDAFKKGGYDAFVDPEDSTMDENDYPIVVINPKNSIRKTKKKWE